MRILLVVVLLIASFGTVIHAAPQSQTESNWQVLLSHDFETEEFSPILDFSTVQAIREDADGNHFLQLRGWEETLTANMGQWGQDYQMKGKIRFSPQSKLLFQITSSGSNCIDQRIEIETTVAKMITAYRWAEGGCRDAKILESDENFSLPENTWLDWQLEITGETMLFSLEGQEVFRLNRDFRLMEYFKVLNYGQIDLDDFQIEMQTRFSAYTPPPVSEWEDRFNHFRGLAFKLPPGFEMSPAFLSTYQNDNTQIQIVSWSWNGARPGLGLFCEELNQKSFVGEREMFENYCLIDPPQGLEWAFPSAALLLIPVFDSETQASRYEGAVGFVITGQRDIIQPMVEALMFVESPTAVQYVEEALRTMGSSYAYLDGLEWEALYAEAMGMVTEDSPLEEAHAALAFVMEQVQAAGDSHSYFEPPDSATQTAQNVRGGSGVFITNIPDEPVVAIVYPGSNADKAGLQVGDIIESVNGLTVPEYNQARADGTLDMSVPLLWKIRRGDETLEFSILRAEYSNFLPVEGRHLTNRLGYIETFSLSGASSIENKITYVTSAHEIIREIDYLPTCGWIVDVRRNTGGDATVMNLAYAPILGEGRWLGSEENHITKWLAYASGVWYASSISASAAGDNTLFIEDPYQIGRSNPPVAVLVSPVTASAGEYTAMHFLTRPEGTTRIFGEETAGLLADGTRQFILWDDGFWNVTTRRSVDLDGNYFPKSIVPDEVIPTDYSVYGTDDDPLIQAAVAWLLEQPECDIDIRYINSGGNRINVRSGAGTDFEALGKIDDDTPVEVLRTSDDGTWLEIRFEGSTGWVAAEFVATDLE